MVKMMRTLPATRCFSISRLPARRAAGRYGRYSRSGGFTLIELIVVVAVIGILATLALPNLRDGPVRANEAVLKTNLHTLRQCLDMHAGDKGFYPSSLDALVEEGYLREVPYDPFHQAQEWGTELETDDGGEFDDFELAETDLLEGAGEPGIIDVYSLSEAVSLDGTPYSEW